MLGVFQICQKETWRQCVRANDGEGGGKQKWSLSKIVVEKKRGEIVVEEEGEYIKQAEKGKLHGPRAKVLPGSLEACNLL